MGYGKRSLLKVKEDNKKIRDKNLKAKNLALIEGDMVYMQKPKKNHKFDTPYEGPYPVIKVTGDNDVIIKRKNKLTRVHKNHLKKLILNN